MENLIDAPTGRLYSDGVSARLEAGLAETFSSSLAPDLTTRAPDVVVGLGNEIACDDGVGIAAARELERRLTDCRPPGGGSTDRDAVPAAGRQQVEVVPLPWAGFSLLDVLAGRRRAALIDCLVSGEHPPGTVVRLDEHDVRGSVRLNSFHDVAFPTVLALGRDLGWAMPEDVAIWAIEAAVVDRFGGGLSAPVAAAAHQVVDEVLTFLDPGA